MAKIGGLQLVLLNKHQQPSFLAPHKQAFISLNIKMILQMATIL